MSTTDDQPVGALVTSPSATFPVPTTLKGRYITLIPLSPSLAPALFPHISGEQNAALWTYLLCEAPLTLEALTAEITYMCSLKDMVPFAVVPHDMSGLRASHVDSQVVARVDGKPGTEADSHATLQPGTPLGIVALMSIAPAHQRVEIGPVLFAPVLQRTTAATEAVSLLLHHSFDDLGFRRVEWKCNALNERSQRAARRFGFEFEGIFRRHMVLKGRLRDTAWFAITEDGWEDVSAAFKGWVGADEEGKGGLLEWRERLKAERKK